MRILTRHNAGFTIIEIIAILVVIGIIGVTVVGRQISLGTEARTQASIIKNHLRYAQSLSMNSNMIWGIECDGSKYWLFKNGQDGTTDDKVMLPGEDSTEVSLSDKGISMGSFTVAFTREKGEPGEDADASPVASANITITVTGGGDSETITVTRNTGYIP